VRRRQVFRQRSSASGEDEDRQKQGKAGERKNEVEILIEEHEAQLKMLEQKMSDRIF
jgi:hypothetical protein